MQAGKYILCYEKANSALTGRIFLNPDIPYRTSWQAA
jgi:hypothetical protein